MLEQNEKFSEENRNTSSELDSDRLAREWALKLFRKSPLKQRKLEFLTEFMDAPAGKRCLDLGSDNGVISLLLREQGGEWFSADLDHNTVQSIRQLVKDNVEQINGRVLPYSDQQFDQVVVVDMFEHLEDDSALADEINRVLKPGGVLVANVPNPKEGLIRKLRYALGQTDEVHGHLRPGYTLEQLSTLLSPWFDIERNAGYSRCFSELIDTVIRGGVEFIKGHNSGDKKGTVVTGQDIGKLEKSFKLYSLLYPFIAFFSKLDAAVPFAHGNMLIVRAVKRG